MSQGDDAWMKRVAGELNLTTVFVTSRPGGADNEFNLRYFVSNGSELPLCGHATLAASSILYSKSFVPMSDPISFFTFTGLQLSATSPSPTTISLDFPLNFPKPLPASDSSVAGVRGEILETLHLSFGVPSDAVVFLGTTADDAFVQLTKEAFAALPPVPDLAVLKRPDAGFRRGIILSCCGDVARSNGANFSNRFFAPKVGIDEDPTCGAAHCALAAFFYPTMGNSLLGWQDSKRGGYIHCEVVPDKKRVMLSGPFYIVSFGTLTF
jgi:PhzF family phenazine biosynthesis protein